MAVNSRMDRRARIDLFAVLAIAFALRLAVGFGLPGIAHPDEIFQYLEPAHRLVYGSGVLPWEWRLGIRSWLWPGALAGLMALCRIVSDSPFLFRQALAVLLALLWLPVVASGWAWGRHRAGRAGGLAAGVLNAVWFEPLYLSVHPLIDTVAAALFVPGFCLAYPAPASPGRLRGAGLLIGLAVALRVQLLPVAALGVLWLCGRNAWRWRAMLAGGAVPVLLAGGLDWISFGAPYFSYVRYVRMNLSGAAALFGTAPAGSYLLWQAAYASGLIVPIAVCAIIGARRLPLLMALACGIVLSFSLIGHKEDRFILPALPFWLTLAGIGSASLAGRFAGARSAGPLCAAWAASSLLLGTFGPYRFHWRQSSALLRAAQVVDADRQACGLAIAPASLWFLSGGHSILRPGIGLFAADGGTGAYDYELQIRPDSTRMDPPSGYTLSFCEPGHVAYDAPVTYCLWHRAGGCTGGAPPLEAPTPPGITAAAPP